MLEVFKKHDNRDFCQVHYLTKGRTDFNQFMRLTNQLVIETENFGRDGNLPPLLLPTMSKDMDEQLKPAHKVVDDVDRPNRNGLCDSYAVQYGQTREFIC